MGYEYDNEFELIGEENEEDLLIENLQVFNQAVIWGTDWTTETIISQLQKDNIDLDPKFQRRDAWDQYDKSRLIESLILGLPVPPIILAERKGVKNKYIVIDGKQRLLTLRQFSASENDDFDMLVLKNLQFLTSLNGKTFNDLEDNFEFNDYKTQFENQTIRTIVIRNWPNEKFLYAVFLRLNTGSKKLSPQELRQALHPGDFLDFLDEETAKSEVFMRVLRNSKPDARMRDVELALRYFAFKHNIGDFHGNLKEFLDGTCEELNGLWELKKNNFKEDFNNLEEAIRITMDIFGEKEAFSRYSNGYSNRFNRALYEVFTYYLSIPEVREQLEGKKGTFKEMFEMISQKDRAFNDSISSTTKDIRKLIYRFTKIHAVLKEIIDCEIPRLNVTDGTVSVEWG
ncbi:DUF262 domain-containing protein [Paenibacillus sp. FSL R10-2734]|uniref:DUF262 domain-containing protein n=1 Tax=Paenibacillus sp. FSL R10-2734 TaxID=2954691 RepID=UPI0030D83D03